MSKIDLQVKHIFTRIVSNEDSFSHRGKPEFLTKLGNGLIDNLRSLWVVHLMVGFYINLESKKKNIMSLKN